MEARIEKDDALADLDARLKEEHLNILTRCEISKWNQTITNPYFFLIAGSINVLRASSCMEFPLCNWWMILRGAGWSRARSPENTF